MLRFLLNEPGADEVEAILEGDEPVALPFVALMEVQYILLRRLPPERVDQLIAIVRALRADIPESNPTWGERAAAVKSRGGLSLADAWISSLALLRNAVLVHRDPEFDSVAGLRGSWLGPRAAAKR